MRTYALISAALFGLVAAGHLVRAALGVELLIDGTSLPIGVSWAGGLIAAALSVWGLRIAASSSGR